MFSEVRQRVELTHAIKDNLLKAIELDPDNDYAYHVLARFEHTYGTREWFGAISRQKVVWCHGTGHHRARGRVLSARRSILTRSV
jgi:hypothetical protein